LSSLLSVQYGCPAISLSYFNHQHFLLLFIYFVPAVYFIQIMTRLNHLFIGYGVYIYLLFSID